MLRVLAESFVVSPPSGVTIKTRLRPTPAEEQALREVGTFLGSLYRADLVTRLREGKLDAQGRARSRKVRKKYLTAQSSSRWAGSITRATQDQYDLAVRALAAGRGRDPLRKFAGRRDEHGPLGGQCPHLEVVLVLGRPGDRAGPPRRRLRSQSLLANLAGARPALSVQLPLAQPPHQVGAVQRPEERAHLPQRLLLGRGRVQPGPDRHPRRR